MSSSLVIRLCMALVTIWWASLLMLGAWIVPSLFKFLPVKAMAGQMAANLFSTQTWIALVCGMLLLMLGRSSTPSHASRWCQAQQMLLLGALLCALLVEFAIAPRIVARESLALWHSIGSALLLLELVLASVLMWRLPLQHAP